MAATHDPWSANPCWSQAAQIADLALPGACGEQPALAGAHAQSGKQTLSVGPTHEFVTQMLPGGQAGDVAEQGRGRQRT